MNDHVNWWTSLWFAWTLFVGIKLVVFERLSHGINMEDPNKLSTPFQVFSPKVNLIWGIVINVLGIVAMVTHRTDLGFPTGILTVLFFFFAFGMECMMEERNILIHGLVFVAKGPGWIAWRDQVTFIPDGSRAVLKLGYYFSGVVGKCGGGCCGCMTNGATAQSTDRTREMRYRPLIKVSKEMSRADFLQKIAKVRKKLRNAVSEMLDSGRDPQEIAKYLQSYSLPITDLDVSIECISFHRPEVWQNFPEHEATTDTASCEVAT